MNPQELEAKRDLVLEAAPKSPSPLPQTLLCNRQTQISKLVNNHDENSTISVTDKKLEIAFNEPVWVEDISLTLASGQDVDGAGLQLDYKPVYEQEPMRSTIGKGSSSEQYCAEINDLIDAIEITTAQGLPGAHVVLRDIRINGYRKSELPSVSSGIHDFTQRLRQFEKSVDQQISEFRNMESKLGALHRQVTQLQKERDTLTDENAQLESQNSALTESNSKSLSRLRKAKEDEARLANNIRSLKSGTGITKQRLYAASHEMGDRANPSAALINRSEPYTNELHDYDRQGTRNAIQYLLASVVPMLVIAGVAYMLFHGAAELSFDIKWLYNPDQAVNLFLARLPFTVLSLFVVYCSWYLARMLIIRVTRIYDERMRITKLAILAREVTTAAADGLDVSDEARLAIRTKLKMDMLKAYLEKDLGRDYRFAPRQAGRQPDSAAPTTTSSGSEQQETAAQAKSAVVDPDTERSLKSSTFAPG